MKRLLISLVFVGLFVGLAIGLITSLSPMSPTVASAQGREMAIYPPSYRDPDEGSLEAGCGDGNLVLDAYSSGRIEFTDLLGETSQRTAAFSRAQLGPQILEEVKFKGTIIERGRYSDADSWLINVEEVTLGRISPGWHIRINVSGWDPCHGDVDFNTKAGDFVEVYGLILGSCPLPLSRLYDTDLSSTCEVTVCAGSDFYLRKVTVTPTIDVWVDRGCGATYNIGDSIVIYFRTNQTGYVTVNLYKPDGSQSTLVNHFLAQAMEHQTCTTAITPSSA